MNKAPGPNNIPVEFYQHYWEVVKADIMHLFDDFYNGTLDVQRLNYGVILPYYQKSRKQIESRNFVLSVCIYKVIATTLTIRLDPMHTNHLVFNKIRSLKVGICWMAFFFSAQNYASYSCQEKNWHYLEIGLRKSVR